MAFRYTSMAFRQSSFCSSFRAVSFSFSRFMRLGAEEEKTAIRFGVRERYRAAKTRASARWCNDLHAPGLVSTNDGKGLGSRLCPGPGVEGALYYPSSHPFQVRSRGPVGSERRHRRVERAQLVIQPAHPNAR